MILDKSHHDEILRSISSALPIQILAMSDLYKFNYTKTLIKSQNET